jgi:RNA polymerase sigma factor (sigma-70 family)
MSRADAREVAERSDRSLLRRFRAGQHDAATELYLRYASRLLALAGARTSPSLASRFDPEDVVQSVFRTFFRRAAAGLYEVPPGDELWQLFLVIALNKVRAFSVHHRAQKRDVTRTAGSAVVEAYAGSVDQTPRQMLQMVIDELLTRLPEVEQQMIRLRVEGYDVRQIAERTERSKRTVERVLQRFRHELSASIDDPHASDTSPTSNDSEQLETWPTR